MLSIALLSGSGGAADYFCEHREVDYYVDGNSTNSHWVGAAARDLGLSGEVGTAVLIAVLEGRHPSSGSCLVPSTRDTHRPGWDCTFSAPKSVSIIQALASTEAAGRLNEAHDAAVRAALGVLEREALVARRGRGGQVHERAAGMVAATFTHHLSRNLDPQLHTHCLIANLAPRTDGGYGAIESKAIFEWKMAAGAVYRAELSARLRTLGYVIEADGTSFRVSGLSKDIEKVFSSRRAEIEVALAKAGDSSPRDAEKAALRTRQQKVAVDGLHLDRRWDQRLQEVGISRAVMLKSIAEACRQRSRDAPTRPRDLAVILRALTDQQSVFRPRDVYKLLAIEAQLTGGGLEAIERRYQQVIRHAETVMLRDGRGELCFSTREMVALEARLVTAVMTATASSQHRLPPDRVARAIESATSTLSSEQRRAVEHCCSGRDIAIVNGVAGSGKSTMAKVIHEAYRSADYRLIGASLSGKAAQSLEAGSGIPSQTIHSLLADLDQDRASLDRRSVVVLDEAAMVGSRLMARLYARVRDSGAKLILIGDVRQLQPIEAGGIYNALLDRIGCASLTTIRRQREVWAAEAVKDVAAGHPERVLAAFEEHGQLVSDKDGAALRDRLVRDWFEASAAADKPADTIMLAATRTDVSTLNRCARAVLRHHQKIAEDELTDAHGTPWSAKDRILFTRNSRLLGIRNGDLGIVRTVLRESDGLHFVVDLDDRRVVRFGGDYPHIEHGYALTVHKSQGSTVEKAFVLMNVQMLDREWGYVAVSRARDATRLYCQEGLQLEMARALGRSRLKDTSLDYDRETDLEFTRG